MSHLFTRNLTFQSNNLGKEATIMLTFDADMEGLYEDFFPVVWKVSTFGKTGGRSYSCVSESLTYIRPLFPGPYEAHATYTSQLAFSKPQVVDGNIIDAETSVKINVSEKTTLTVANDVYHFSPPQAGVAGVLQAVNSTGDVQDIAVGFMSPKELMPKPALYFNGVGDGSHVTARFTPVLRVYVTSDYQQTAIIRGAIDTPAIWSQDLAELAESTTWTLNRDAATGHYTIVQS
ncbi:uncharacterized protein BJ212DRAFT_457403 [Suillus subaureus]|uniref:Uncharacterized protein n=1 Tax=Suillus subaureus TaxID=48587 RepID=A0A9P7E6F0_9AGAM|nr:uncharacterized protein BJ212DRAFT_457403 [Suillus subaureus]KAG1812562.1 hypothetical protein BJ212DRAFT_457403 [Suillus subaureus]